jgi:hypothetical protein
MKKVKAEGSKVRFLQLRHWSNSFILLLKNDFQNNILITKKILLEKLTKRNLVKCLLSKIFIYFACI